MLLQSGAQGGEVPVGDTTYAALSKDWGITTIYRTSYPNQTVMLTSEHGVHRKNCRVNTVLTDIRWLNGFNPSSGVKRAWNGSAVQSLHSVNHLSVTETDACCQHTVHNYIKTQTRGHCSSGDLAGGPIRIGVSNTNLSLHPWAGHFPCLLWMWLSVRRWVTGCHTWISLP